MKKQFLALLALPLLVAGCATSITNLTPLQQPRNANNVYPVEVAFDSTQQTIRWDSIEPHILIGSEAIPMRGTLLMTNRWEGVVPVPPTASTVTYRYKFDYECNAFGKPKAGSQISKAYTLKIVPPEAH
ncbi:MAG TPA: hypothetical protein VMU04_05785 [Candidatus Acidoferrum sp.]|nr:hypothetical protein [Candidatus Acidoferrum sp.]